MPGTIRTMIDEVSAPVEALAGVASLGFAPVLAASADSPAVDLAASSLSLSAGSLSALSLSAGPLSAGPLSAGLPLSAEPATDGGGSAPLADLAVPVVAGLAGPALVERSLP